MKKKSKLNGPHQIALNESEHLDSNKMDIMKTQLHRNRIIYVADIDISPSADIRQFVARKNGVRQIKAKKNNIYDSYTLVLNIAIVTNQNCLEI